MKMSTDANLESVTALLAYLACCLNLRSVEDHGDGNTEGSNNHDRDSVTPCQANGNNRAGSFPGSKIYSVRSPISNLSKALVWTEDIVHDPKRTQVIIDQV